MCIEKKFATMNPELDYIVFKFFGHHSIKKKDKELSPLPQVFQINLKFAVIVVVIVVRSLFSDDI